ncbi:PLAC8 family protein [Hibiscus syriacus]|uniref:PLAC8 family protein n=1 Tax=Hibiscus syriacus TaxID=106335 RepID=A0A6A2ZTZ0_HIBSY|nr:zinc finger protein CONSTANS-LIKE 1-like [Hibiscus syriacus]KAE8694325.1 PLAC8 family protein [Hibiscus syriacus]
MGFMGTIDYGLLFDDLPCDSSSSSGYDLQALLNSNGNQQQNPDQSVSGFSLPPSPTTDQLENRGLYQASQFQSPSFSGNSDKGYQDFYGLDCLEVNKEESKVDIGTVYHDENVENSQTLSLPENNFFSGQMTNVFNNGDSENSFMEELPGFKVGRYSPAERQERISKYRAKRNRRNFNKTIKYACRKTVADNLPRIRGRFARNDETAEIPKAACSTRDEHQYESWTLPEVGDEIMAKGTFMNSFSLHQFGYHQHGRF